MRLYFVFCIICLVVISCHQHSENTYLKSYKNIQWQLLAFEDTTHSFKVNDIIWLDAEFFTQNDSVFWNSHHEGSDKFFIQLKDTIHHPFYFPFYLSSLQDSLMIIAPVNDILNDIFNVFEIPAFLKNDSIIKCFFKIKKKITCFDNTSLNVWKKNEFQEIESFLQKNKLQYQTDTNQIIWLEPLPIPSFKPRPDIKEATVAYSGYFLDGRLIDHSDSLGIRYNDTLQLLEGLNYVIKKMDVGQSAKIILPSHLAFGSRGSLNKTIPPFTPLLYEIQLLNIK